MARVFDSRLEEVTFRGFRGWDALKTALYPESFIAQEAVREGLLLDARNMGFTRDGRCYWKRNQLSIDAPPTIYRGNAAPSVVAASPGGAVRNTNVVTITTTAAHGFTSDDIGCNVIVAGVAPVGATVFNGVFPIASVSGTTSFTYAQTADDDTGGGGTVTPAQPSFLAEFVASAYSQDLAAYADYKQVLLVGRDGILRVLHGGAYTTELDWGKTPEQWKFGYELWDVDTVDGDHPETWVEAATGLPGVAWWGSAMAKNRLLLSSGVSAGFTQGMETRMWTGEDLLAVGIPTPSTVGKATVDDTAPVSLVQGTYSYQVAFANDEFESMGGPVLDVVRADVAATGSVGPLTTTTNPQDGDAVTVSTTGGSMTYVFTTTSPGAYQIPIAADALTTYQYLIALMREGGSYVIVGGQVCWQSSGGQALPGVSVEFNTTTYAIELTATEIGSGGNSYTISTNHSERITVSTFSGGVGSCQHIDLSDIPLLPTGYVGTNPKRKLYRAYTESVEPQARGDVFQLLGEVPDNTTTGYEDNTPQYALLSEAAAFDHARPPRGDHLVYFKDRAWMAGVCYGSDSYWLSCTVLTLSRAAGTGVVTAKTLQPHRLKVGDSVVVSGTTPDATTNFDRTGTVLTVPSDRTCTYQEPDDPVQADDTATGGCAAVQAIEVENLQNRLYFSKTDDPYYWPAANFLTVGDNSPIVGLCGWQNSLLVLKQNSVWLVSGWSPDDFSLDQIDGATGAIGPHVAASPYGVMWAAHEGWVLWDGHQSRLVCPFREQTDFVHEPSDIYPPPDDVRFPCIAYHDGRFHIWAGDHSICWIAENDTWEIARRKLAFCGVTGYAGDIEQSHVLAFMRWGDLSIGYYFLTALDNQHRPPDTMLYYDSQGTEEDEHYGEVRLEFPPLVGAPGELVDPREVWLDAEWEKPAETGDDLKLQLYVDDLALSSIARENDTVTSVTAKPHLFTMGQTVKPRVTVEGVTVGGTTFNGSFEVASVPDAFTLTWAQVGTTESGSGGHIRGRWKTLGTAVAGGGLAIPGGYAMPLLRFVLYGLHCRYLVVQALTIRYTKRAARAAG